MKANEIYHQKADQIYAEIGHAVMQRKQIEEKITIMEIRSRKR